MKVLVWAPAPWLPTAFSKNAGMIARGLKLKGYDVYFLATSGFLGKGTWKEIPIWGHQPSIAILGYLIEGLGIEHVIQHFDAWLYGTSVRNLGLSEMISCYTPVEDSEIPMAIFDATRGSYIVAMSETVQRAWQQTGRQAVWIPHAVDPQLYHPVSIEKKIAFLKEFGIPEKAVVFCIVGANNWRKNLGMQVRAFAHCVHSLPEPPYLILHTQLDENADDARGASNLSEMISRLKIGKYIRTPAQWSLPFYPEEELVKVYQASDINLLATCGEAFGLPIIEAGACGVPSIVTAGGAADEVKGDGGLAVKIATRFYRMAPLTWGVYPSYTGLCQAMKKLAVNYELRADKGNEAFKNAGKYYKDQVLKYWDWYLKGKPQIEVKRKDEATCQ